MSVDHATRSMATSEPQPLGTPMDRLPTGVRGFDDLSGGGLPRARTTLVVGTSGSGKTLLALECLYKSISCFGRSGVLVSFEEREQDLLKNVAGLGWDLQSAVDAGRLTIIDASVSACDVEQVGQFDLGGLLQQIRYAVQKTEAEVVVLDAMGSLFAQFSDDFMIRREIYRIAEMLSELGATTMMTGERLHEYGLISRYGVEEFVSDVVVILRNVLEEERCRRTMQILKLRGGDHLKGEFAFTITDEGLVILPIVSSQLAHSSSTERIPSGCDKLDTIAGGGFFRDSIILISGATGTGKTLLSTTFAEAGCRAGQKTLLLAYEESRPQLLRNATGWGMGFERWEEQGLLQVLCSYPESLGLEDHMVRIRREIERFRPERLVVDSLSALERVGSHKVFREFVIGLSAFVKERNICTLLTSTTPALSGGESITEAHISTLTDAIILLRYVEIGSRLRRGLAAIKMRGSAHSKDVYEYQIDQNGIHIGDPFQNVHGVILGSPQFYGAPEEAMLTKVFE